MAEKSSLFNLQLHHLSISDEMNMPLPQRLS